MVSSVWDWRLQRKTPLQSSSKDHYVYQTVKGLMKNAAEVYFGNFKIPFTALKISTALILTILLFNMQICETGKLNRKHYLEG